MTDSPSPGGSVAALLRRSKTVLGVAVVEESGIAWTRVEGGPPDRLEQPVRRAALDPAPGDAGLLDDGDAEYGL